jgi:hypothetical protein
VKHRIAFTTKDKHFNYYSFRINFLLKKEEKAPNPYFWIHLALAVAQLK